MFSIYIYMYTRIINEKGLHLINFKYIYMNGYVLFKYIYVMK